jgi:taurine dioxygenase
VTDVTNSTLAIRALHPMGAEVLNCKVIDLVDNIILISQLKQALTKHQFLLFRDQRLSAGEQVVFSSHFGQVVDHSLNAIGETRRKASQIEGFPQTYFFSNVGEDGRMNGNYPDVGTLRWHSDTSWKQITGGKTILYAVEVPSIGGETCFADMYTAYQSLSYELRKRLDNMHAIHSLKASHIRYYPTAPLSKEQLIHAQEVTHPVVITHPETMRKCIFLGDHASSIVGMDETEGRSFIEELNQFITSPKFVFCHLWKPNDLIVWDNQCLLHRGSSYNVYTEKRVLRRSTTLGQIPI